VRAAAHLLRRAAAWLRAGSREPYEAFRRERLAQRRAGGATPEPGLLSFVTTAWDTDPGFLRVLADSLLPQLASGQEWVLLDNGSSAAPTRALLAELGRNRHVRLLRAGQNLGIIGGMRRCLEAARGRYVVPVDSDDYLYPDCARLLGAFVRERQFPALLYTDEDKRDGERFFEAYFKPDWDPVLFVNSCYIAHLCAFERARALELGVYGDARAEGCHDWDTYLRFYGAGHAPAHLPEVLYSWRVHAQSTSAHINSKDYIQRSHEAVLGGFLAARPHAGRFSLELSPLFGGTPDRWFRRRRVDPRPITGLRLPAGPLAGPLRAAAESAQRAGGLVHLVGENVRPAGDEWSWEALGLMELFPDCVLVGGRIYGADRRVHAASAYFGFGWGCGYPDRGRGLGDPGFFAQMWKQHSVDAVSVQHAVVEPAFLLDALERHGDRPLGRELLGAWLGLHARRGGRRVVYTPFLEAECDHDWEDSAPADEKRAFLDAARELLGRTPLLSPRLGLWPDAAYQPVRDAARAAHLARLKAA